MTDLPFEIDFALDDWQAGDGNAAFNPIPAKLNLRHDRLDLTFDDGRAVWIEQQDGTIRIHGYLSEETGHDGPVNLDCAFRDHPITGSDNIRSVIPI